MDPAPRTIGDAQVIAYTIIDARHRATGNTLHTVRGAAFGPAAGLAICRYPGEDGFYLFYCDSAWEPVTDTWHETLDDAEQQAEFEYESTQRTWQQHG
jgi:hypothetical protein